MKKTKLLKILFLLIFMPKVASAVYINQVLYDPSGSESTGEAIEFYNPSSMDVDISGWIIATETSQKDAVIPANSIIKADGYFLVADEGWNTTNSSWRNADYEEKITMNNDNSGIALKDANETVIDAVGWGNASGISNNLYEGTPAKDASEGKVLLRIKDTGNNEDDFTEADPDFSDPNAIRISVNITNNTDREVSSARIDLDDDSGKEGTQIKPVSGGKKQVKIVVVAPNGATATFLNSTIELDEVDENTYEGILELDSSLAPGNYTVDVNDGQEQIEFEYLALMDLRVQANKISFNAIPGKESVTEKSAVIKNTGNVELSIVFGSSSDLKSGNYSISSDNLKISIDKKNFYELSEGITVKPGEEANLYFSLFVPKGTKTGSYSSIVALKAEEN